MNQAKVIYNHWIIAVAVHAIQDMAVRMLLLCNVQITGDSVKLEMNLSLTR